ncbi:sodium-independent sulfate anion transporter-like [Saccoglossus kowalevskii]|uniref:Sodium-independent sulfate anion transporter-like n=1 Tax=Saccoglossus kowalevskii TaxID=10224 RepID=A0ABM0MMS7_SACKO|nr:PREDICTED: sodium-independent sulfate anion transporter-like [Saccoglossus kowalevskii]
MGHGYDISFYQQRSLQSNSYFVLQSVTFNEGAMADLLGSQTEPLMPVSTDTSVVGSINIVDGPNAAMTVKQGIRDFFRKSCTVKNWKKKLPITIWLPKYKPSYLLNDFIAGLTVGLTVIPQGLAYATVAKLPLQYGLYSAFMGCFVYCLLGTSKDITLGPTAIMSLMVGQFGGEEDPTTGFINPIYAVILTFICGCIQLAMGILQLGFLVNFISYPVINGFTTSAAVTIGTGQIKHVLGIKYHANDFLGDVEGIIKNIKDTNLWDLLMAAVCFVILIVLKILKTKVSKWEHDSCEDEDLSLAKKILWKVLWLIGTARNAVVVITAALFAWSLHASGHHPFTLVGEIPAGLPHFEPPDFNDPSQNITSNEIVKELNVGIVIVPLIGFLESIAIGKAFARENKYKIDSNQELIALGGANVFSSFISSYPVTGSFSRTAVNSQSGVKTPLGGVFTGSLVLLALGLLTPQFQYIPQAALASVIITAVAQMVDCKIVLKLWKVKKLDLLPLFATFIISLLLGIEIGIIVGIALDLLIVLYKTARPKIQVVSREILVIKVGHGIHFPAVEHITTSVLEYGLGDEDDIERALPKAVILDCSHVDTVDYTTIQGMTELLYEYRDAGVKLVFAALEQSIREVFLLADISGFTTYGNVNDAVSALVDEFGEQLQHDPNRRLLDVNSDSSTKQKSYSGTDNK